MATIWDSSKPPYLLADVLQFPPWVSLQFKQIMIAFHSFYLNHGSGEGMLDSIQPPGFFIQLIIAIGGWSLAHLHPWMRLHQYVHETFSPWNPTNEVSPIPGFYMHCIEIYFARLINQGSSPYQRDNLSTGWNQCLAMNSPLIQLKQEQLEQE